ncbi:MAG TPA: PASTA domain-containing protein [Gaiellaceae bacterium]|nr:PASTA domain-containing protein [Gaiellaceae bacterium]
MAASVVVACLLVVAVGSASATPGVLDPSFGTGGTTTTAIGSAGAPAEAYAVALQPDGKILLAGGDAIARYDSEGSLDPTFGSGGIVTTSIELRGIAVQSDGKIVVAGSGYDGSAPDFAVARYNADGSIDSSFGSGGEVTTDPEPPRGGEAWALALQPDGKIVVGGVNAGGYFVLARYLSSGALDTGFGSGGIVDGPFGELRALALQSDGKILAAGSGTSDDFLIARFDLDGSPDTTFGTDGVVGEGGGGNQTVLGTANALAVEPGGTIVVVGAGHGNLNWTGVGIMALNADGSVDSSFASGGEDIRIESSTQALGNGLALEPDGKIVAAGLIDSGQAAEFLVLRFDSNGTLDPDFGTDGVVTTQLAAAGTDGSTAGSAANAVVVQPDGKIVVGGGAFDGNTSSSFALARYLGTSTLSVSKSGSGSGTVSSSPAGIDCGPTCSESVAGGPVTLTATPAADSSFTGWSGACSGTGACTVPLSSDTSVTADFEIVQEGLAVAESGDDGGRVVSNPAGIDCGSVCDHDFEKGTVVTLTARPDAGARFAGWAGGCSGKGVCAVTMSTSRMVTAIFRWQCVVPSLRGRAVRAAKRLLGRAGCSLGKVTKAYSRMASRGKVIGQKPVRGAVRPAHAKVRIVVGEGKRSHR